MLFSALASPLTWKENICTLGDLDTLAVSAMKRQQIKKCTLLNFSHRNKLIIHAAEWRNKCRNEKVWCVDFFLAFRIA